MVVGVGQVVGSVAPDSSMMSIMMGDNSSTPNLDAVMASNSNNYIDAFHGVINDASESYNFLNQVASHPENLSTADAGKIQNEIDCCKPDRCDLICLIRHSRWCT